MAVYNQCQILRSIPGPRPNTHSRLNKSELHLTWSQPTLKRLLIILAAIIAIGLYFWIGSAPRNGEGFSMPPPVVRVDEARYETLVDTIESLGTIRAWEAVDITAKTAGKVAAIHFRDNGSIKAGQVIVELEAGSEQAALREAEVVLKEDSRLLQHYRTLAKTNAVSETMLEEQQARVNASQERVKAARAVLAEFQIRAPFSGQLGLRQVSVGALVTPGTLITTLDATDTLKMDFTVPERWLGRIAEGQTLKATSVAYPEEVFTGAVTSIGTRLDPVTRAVSVQARIPNPDGKLRPGMLLSLVLESAPREALMINEQALLQEASTKFVYRVKDDLAVEKVAVVSGTRRNGRVEIAQGLAAGDKVVAEGTQKVRDGVVVVLGESGGKVP